MGRASVQVVSKAIKPGKQREIPRDALSLTSLHQTEGNFGLYHGVCGVELDGSSSSSRDQGGGGGGGGEDSDAASKSSRLAYLPVSVKLLREGCTDEEKKALLAEANTMVQFAHPHVLACGGIVSDVAPFMIVHEPLRLGYLPEYLEQMFPDVGILRKFALDLAGAIDYVNSRGCVHWDVAARNVGLDSKLSIKLCNFGRRKTVDDPAPDGYYTSPTGARLLRWSAPEVGMMEGAARKPHIQEDIWGYGIFLYELFTKGRIPYTAATWVSRDMYLQTMTDFQEGALLPQPVACPEEIYDIMADCWETEPSRRPSFKVIRERLCSTQMLKELEAMLNLGAAAYVNKPLASQASATPPTPSSSSSSSSSAVASSSSSSSSSAPAQAPVVAPSPTTATAAPSGDSWGYTGGPVTEPSSRNNSYSNGQHEEAAAGGSIATSILAANADLAALSGGHEIEIAPPPVLETLVEEREQTGGGGGEQHQSDSELDFARPNLATENSKLRAELEALKAAVLAMQSNLAAMQKGDPQHTTGVGGGGDNGSGGAVNPKHNHHQHHHVHHHKKKKSSGGGAADSTALVMPVELTAAEETASHAFARARLVSIKGRPKPQRDQVTTLEEAAPSKSKVKEAKREAKEAKKERKREAKQVSKQKSKRDHKKGATAAARAQDNANAAQTKVTQLPKTSFIVAPHLIGKISRNAAVAGRLEALDKAKRASEGHGVGGIRRRPSFTGRQRGGSFHKPKGGVSDKITSQFDAAMAQTRRFQPARVIEEGDTTTAAMTTLSTTTAKANVGAGTGSAATSSRATATAATATAASSPATTTLSAEAEAKAKRARDKAARYLAKWGQ